jgi:hypothetical protein
MFVCVKLQEILNLIIRLSFYLLNWDVLQKAHMCWIQDLKGLLLVVSLLGPSNQIVLKSYLLVKELANLVATSAMHSLNLQQLMLIKP